MAQIGYGYGSEFQLLRFMGRHRDLLDNEIKKQINQTGEIHWLDFGFTDLDATFIGDEEQKGLAFLESVPFASVEQIRSIREEISKYKVGRMVASQSWDALFTIGDTLYLVEAKAHCEEMLTSNHERAANKAILSFMEEELPTLKVTEEWVKDYYQLANRLATTALLNKHGIKANTLCLFFENGYKKKAIINEKLTVLADKDTSKEDFEKAIKIEMDTLGISHEMVSHLMTPCVFINANPNKK
ncbi:MAG: hypothetical protein MSS61_01955 [Bacteroidales bacterium]|nr:hypothetical protein [Bacteroidales bacterium]